MKKQISQSCLVSGKQKQREVPEKLMYYYPNVYAVNTGINNVFDFIIANPLTPAFATTLQTLINILASKPLIRLKYENLQGVPIFKGHLKRKE